MTSLPSGYSVRPGRIDDIPTVAALDAAYDTAILGAPYVDEDWVREAWTWHRFDPAVDAWLVTSPAGEPAAYAQICDEKGNGNPESVVHVHPDHWGRGLGSALIGIVEARAREYARAAGGSVTLLSPLTAADAAARTLLERAGYALDRHFWHMYLDLAGPLPQTPVPDGIVVRGFDRAVDAAAVHEVLETAFERHYLYSPTPFAEWVAQQLDSEHFEEDLWLVAVDGDRIVAVLSGRRLMGEAWVSDVGVLPQWRGRGIGAALLAESFRIFEQRGFGTVALNVDAANETGATALYERVGMRVRLQWDLYAKTVRSSPAL
jgi:mycothiol synthase